MINAAKTVAQRAERFENLRRVLREVQVAHEKDIAAGKYSPFDMGWWGELWDTSDKKAPSCGTSCCAAGWASKDPWFQANGLKSKIEGCSLDIVFDDPEYEYDTFKGLALFFGITEDESEQIFDPYFYKKPNDEEEYVAADDAEHITPNDVIARTLEIEQSTQVALLA